MSDATKNLRNWRGGVSGDVAVSMGDLRWLADDTQDVIEALAARVAALEKRQGKDAPVETHGHSTTGARADGAESPVADRTSASPAAPSAVPAPRGFREGDICRVIESKRTKENFLVGCEGRINPYRGSGGDWVIDCGTAKGVRCFYNSELTLVRAAAAPEALAEEDTGLVVQRIRDEATKPLHVKIERLRAKLAEAEQETRRLRSIIGPIDGHPSGAENLEAWWRMLRERYGIVGEHTMAGEDRAGVLRVRSVRHTERGVDASKG